jgi:GAG-pre-integrase domain
VHGRGTVQLESQCEGRKFVLHLENVLYIPTNRNNLISLGRWGASGRKYVGDGERIMMINERGVPVATGNKAKNHLYKMDVKLHIETEINVPSTSCTFTSTQMSQNWETWHKRFGHVGYGGLQKLLDKGLVHGFTVDTTSPKPDCVACTEGKLSTEPFKTNV